MIARVLFVLALVTLLPLPVRAQDTTDVQLWLQAIATVRIGEDWRLHLEEQPRWFRNVRESYQVLTRTGVGRRVSDRLTVWAGHAWIAKPPGPGVQHEQRIWQQASVTLPGAGRWTPSVRLRVEQRMQGSWADRSHRVRVMGRGVRPLTADGRWAVAAFDEAFVTLDRTERGPVRGFDQNRLFGGVIRRLHPQASLEAGYMWVVTRQSAGPTQHAHLPFAWLNLTF